MARKAKLDILEIQEEQPKETGEIPAPEGGSAPGKPRSFKKVLVFAALGAFVILSLGGTALWWLTRPVENRAAQQAARQAIPLSSSPVVTLDEFYVPCQGPDGRTRIAVFGLAVELNGQAGEQGVELRKAIYALAKKRGMATWILTEERWELKKSIAAELERRWGTGTVKEVYFTDVRLL